ncbi:MAG: histidine kinase [Propionibacteriaceae bacterium]
MLLPSKTAWRRWRGGLRYLVVEGLQAVLSFALLVAVLLLLPFLALGIGWLAAPRLVELVSRDAATTRSRAGRLNGVAVPDRPPQHPGPVTVERLAVLLAGPETRRLLLWLALHATVVLWLALVAVGLIAGSLSYLLAAIQWWAAPDATPLPLNFEVTSWPTALAAVGVFVLYAVASWLLVPWLAGRIAAAQLSLLGPRRSAVMSERIEALSASRAAALDAHSAELRRIERELHDGAQNRLVAVVMMLGMAHRALEKDPNAALPQLERAQTAATEALSDLRATVHDIYPPVLDELGLGGAASTLTSRSPIPCALDVTALRRAPAAVEAAAYFVLAEALTNAAKHSGATALDVILRTEVTPLQEVLLIEVTDNGHGGAALPVRSTGGRGSGLAGIARRAAAFEGSLTLVSPPGGPTTLKVELPCGY